MKNWIISSLLVLALWEYTYEPNVPYVPELNYKRESNNFCYFTYYQQKTEFFKTVEFSVENLREYLEFRKVRNKEIVYAQAVLETGEFRSTIFKENNNLFGMKYPLVRPTTAQYINRGHAAYNHWSDSVDDYILWYNFMTRNKQYTNYLTFLTSLGYAEDPYYIYKLQNLIKL